MARSPVPSGIRARPNVLRELIAAWEVSPRSEPCGLLLGRLERQVLEVERAVALPNVHETADRAFRIAPADLLRVSREARRAGLEVVGAWHAHPRGAAWPGVADREAMDASRAVTDALGTTPWIHVIVGLGSGAKAVVRAFVLDENEARPVRLRVSR
jgi:proteasome lid subunit RPN8/RPN11